MKKLYYSISEVSKIVDEEQHILRYWEKEFSQLRPKKNNAGNRIYSDKDIQTILQIKHLLRNNKLSLKGAKDKILSMDESVVKSDNLFEYNAVDIASNITTNESVNRVSEQFSSVTKEDDNSSNKKNDDLVYILNDILSLLKEL